MALHDACRSSFCLSVLLTLIKIPVCFTAGSSGGAYLHSGVVVVIKNATFVENRAGDSGLAIMSLGIVENMFDTTFESNTYSCPSGKYGYDIDEEDMDEEQTEVTMLQYQSCLPMIQYCSRFSRMCHLFLSTLRSQGDKVNRGATARRLN